jgi:periplasmic protein TonB
MKNLLPIAAAAAMLASCSAPQPPARKAPVTPPSAAAPAPAPAPGSPMLTMEGYKKAFAQQVAHGNPHLFEDPLPDMFKSIVVLDITIGREGEVLNVKVQRSNGFKALEKIAMDSVRRAAPYAWPSAAVRKGANSVNFLETFLFRNDHKFQIRTLVASAQ